LDSKQPRGAEVPEANARPIGKDGANHRSAYFPANRARAGSQDCPKIGGEQSKAGNELSIVVERNDGSANFGLKRVVFVENASGPNALRSVSVTLVTISSIFMVEFDRSPNHPIFGRSVPEFGRFTKRFRHETFGVDTLRSKG